MMPWVKTASGVKAQMPEDWRTETVFMQQMLISGPAGMMVTVDFELRGFRAGHSRSGNFVGASGRKAFSGRGWKEKLVAYAVAHLREVSK